MSGTLSIRKMMLQRVRYLPLSDVAVAVKEGGPDPDNNSRLRDVIAKAKANNMPNDTIDRGIKKAAGDANANYESVTYEGYGPNGTAIIVDALTDNKNRTAANVRNALSPRARAVLEHRVVYLICSTRRVRSSLTRKSAIWMQMI